MVPLTNETRLAAYLDALSNWQIEDYIQFQLHEQAYKWFSTNLNEISLKDLKRLMNQFVEGGGQIDEVLETRHPWNLEYEFHHDLRMVINGVQVYIETCLNYREPLKKDESWILVVNIHEQ